MESAPLLWWQKQDLFDFLEQLFCFCRLITLGKGLSQFLQHILGTLGVIDGIKGHGLLEHGSRDLVLCRKVLDYILKCQDRRFVALLTVMCRADPVVGIGSQIMLGVLLKESGENLASGWH